MILSGGSGTRLWPVSRASFPKQFVKLIDPERSLLQMAAERFSSLNVPYSGIVVVANNEHRFLVADQLSQIGVDVDAIILEPVARNTAPAVALAAIHALTIDADAKILVQTADHVIPDTDYFCGAVSDAYRSGESLVTLGVIPTRPETGYGYIQVGEAIRDTQLCEVDRFVEKPDAQKAEEYIANGQYLWNSGMFLLDAAMYLEELGIHAPKIVNACRRSMSDAVIDLDFCRVDATAFEKCPSDSIDYAVMEKSESVAVLPFNSEWSDVGAWDVVLEQLPSD